MNKVLRKIFQFNREVATGGQRKLHHEELHSLYSSPNIIRVVKPGIRWVEHVACIRVTMHTKLQSETLNSNSFFVGLNIRTFSAFLYSPKKMRTKFCYILIIHANTYGRLQQNSTTLLKVRQPSSSSFVIRKSYRALHCEVWLGSGVMTCKKLSI
jgi:hypothetical protein